MEHAQNPHKDLLEIAQRNYDKAYLNYVHAPEKEHEIMNEKLRKARLAYNEAWEKYSAASN